MANAPAATRGCTSTRTSNSGWVRRSSMAKNAGPAAAPAAAAQTTGGLVQPASTPSMSANTIPVRATAESATPGTSSGGAPGRPRGGGGGGPRGRRDSGSQRSPSGAANSTKGTLTRKTQRHPATSTSTPPKTGPRASPRPPTADQIPTAFGRSSAGNRTARSDSAGGSTQDA